MDKELAEKMKKEAPYMYEACMNAEEILARYEKTEAEYKKVIAKFEAEQNKE